MLERGRQGWDLKALDLSCWNGAFAEECFCWSDLFSFPLSTSVFSVFAVLLYYLLFLRNCLTLLCCINISLLCSLLTKYISYFLSWWCHCCSACWTGAWPFPWVCCWSPSPCLRWRTAHPTRPRCWTIYTGCVASLAAGSWEKPKISVTTNKPEEWPLFYYWLLSNIFWNIHSVCPQTQQFQLWLLNPHPPIWDCHFN